MSLPFLIKFKVAYYRAAALLRRYSTIDSFLKKDFLYFFQQLVFGTFPECICDELSLQQSFSLKTVGL